MTRTRLGLAVSAIIAAGTVLPERFKPKDQPVLPRAKFQQKFKKRNRASIR